MTIEERLARLERSNRIYRIAAVIVAAIAVAGFAGDPEPQDIRAKSLTIVDRHGNEIIKLEEFVSLGTSHGGVISITDSGGVKSRPDDPTGFSTLGGRPTITLHGGGVFDNDGPSISLRDPGSKASASIHTPLRPDNSVAQFVAWDTLGRERFRMPSSR